MTRPVPIAATAGGTGYYPLGDQPGQSLFSKMCAPCHTIGGGDHVGPDLLGVVGRRDRAWLVDFIINPRRCWRARILTRSRSPPGFPACICHAWGLAKPMPRMSSPICATKRLD